MEVDTLQPRAGLLGLERETPIPIPPDEDDPAVDEEGLGTLRPTGLLSHAMASRSGLDVDEETLEQEAEDRFKPTGLLAMKRATEKRAKSVGDDLASSPPQTPPHADHEEDLDTFSPLQSNGLLSGTRVDDGLPPLSSPQSESQDLPDVDEILRPYARTRSNLNGAGSTAPILPRTSIRATTFTGKSLFLRKKTKRDTLLAKSNTPAPQMGKLLEVPMHRLMDEISSKEAIRLAREEGARVDALNRPRTAPTKPNDTLWVDKYRPQRFTDLLGDERLHREVLGWVKEWDYCVFGKKKGKKRAREGDDDLKQQDQYHRPHEKILLLSGPPGLGKTTVAHVVARQAGYNVFEINASDARSASIVEDRIRPALEAGSTVGSSRPSLVVIDEIDGATGGGDNSAGFIHKLTQMALEKPANQRRKRKEGNGQRPLLRPIICICNDLYASSLAKLRPLARIIRFSRPADIHIVKRLREICELERLKAESRALTTLVGISMGDFRGCLNTLQMLKARNQTVTEPVVRSATSGMKEADTSFNTTLSHLFAPMSKQRVKELGLTEEQDLKYMDRLSRDVEASGALDRVALGCFENYANLHQHDGNLNRYMKANEWLGSYDMLSGQMYSEREYALMPYLSYNLVAFYPLFHVRGGPKVERPKADWENYTRTRANEEIYKSVARAARSASAHNAGHYRHLVSDEILHLEFAPYLNRIISPPLRPVNSQVIRPEEKALLARLVNIMVSLELRFVQEKAEDGQLVYRLDPPVDVFVTYDGKRASDIAVSRYAVRNLVAAEIDAQLIARQAEAVERTKAGKSSSFFGARSAPETDQVDERADGEPTEASGEGTLSRARPDDRPRKRAKGGGDVDIDIADKPAVDFFGRPIKVAQSKPGSRKVPSGIGKGAMGKSTNEAVEAFRVAYKFKEGNSAAVRKPVKMSSFL